MIRTVFSLLTAVLLIAVRTAESQLQNCAGVVSSLPPDILASCMERIPLGPIPPCIKPFCVFQMYVPVAVFEITTDKGYSLTHKNVRNVSSCPIDMTSLQQIPSMTGCICSLPQLPSANSKDLPGWLDNRQENQSGISCSNLGRLDVDQPAIVLGPENPASDFLLCARLVYLASQTNICDSNTKVNYVEPVQTSCMSTSSLNDPGLETPKAQRKVLIYWKQVHCCCPCPK